MFSDSHLLILEGISATSIFISFIAGILTFLSPCILPLLPIYLSYISGISISEFQTTASNARRKIIMQSAAFVVGFSIIFLLIGAAMIRIFSFFFNQPLFFAFNQAFYIYQFAGIVIIIFGLHLTHIISIPFLNIDKRIDLTQNSTASLSAAFLLGISFGLGWSPCIGPILSSIVLLGASDQNSGLWLLVLYTIGLAIPFLFSAFLISSITRIMTKFKPYMGIVEKITGILLIVMGIMVASGLTGEFSAYLLKHYNFI